MPSMVAVVAGQLFGLGGHIYAQGGVRGGHSYAQYGGHGGHTYVQCSGRDSHVCVQCGGHDGHIQYMPNVVAKAAICKPNVVAVTACPSSGRRGLVNQVVNICCSIVRPKKD